MNKFKAAYCRIFQKCFKIAIPFMPYRCPEVFYSTSKLTGLFEEKKINNILIITDEGIRKFGLLDRMIMIKPLQILLLKMLKRQDGFTLIMIAMPSSVLAAVQVLTVQRPSVQK